MSSKRRSSTIALRSIENAPMADEAGLEARRLSALLDGSADRAAVLSRFVADLSDSDEELLRRLLGLTGKACVARRRSRIAGMT